MIVNGLSLVWAAVAVRVRLRWKLFRSKAMDVTNEESLRAPFELSDELLQVFFFFLFAHFFVIEAPL